MQVKNVHLADVKQHVFSQDHLYSKELLEIPSWVNHHIVPPRISWEVQPP